MRACVCVRVCSNRTELRWDLFGKVVVVVVVVAVVVVIFKLTCVLGSKQCTIPHFVGRRIYSTNDVMRLDFLKYQVGID